MEKLKKIKEKLKELEPLIEERFQVKRVGIFGSYIKSKQKKGSDLDILVEFTKEPGLFKFIELEDYLSKRLGSKVDLVMKNALKPTIGKYILNEVIYV